MARSKNAQVAVDLYDHLLEEYKWDTNTAWRGIAILLLSCEVWDHGWQAFHNSIVYRERNDFQALKKGGLNIVLQRADKLSDFLANELGVPRTALCQTIAMYWHQPSIAVYQPHNLVGHAFRSLIVAILQRFGDPGISYSEEVNPYDEFPGFDFTTRSKKAKLDIVARRGTKTVALMSARWRIRHDRVDVVEEALAYAAPAHRHNPDCRLYAIVGEFAPDRLDKILANCPPLHPHAPLNATVHFEPRLITEGLGENGRLKFLRSLAWLIGET